jgi:hypothetical protein
LPGPCLARWSDHRSVAASARQAPPGAPGSTVQVSRRWPGASVDSPCTDRAALAESGARPQCPEASRSEQSHRIRCSMWLTRDGGPLERAPVISSSPGAHVSPQRGPCARHTERCRQHLDPTLARLEISLGSSQPASGAQCCSGLPGFRRCRGTWTGHCEGADALSAGCPGAETARSQRQRKPSGTPVAIKGQQMTVITETCLSTDWERSLVSV